MKLSVCYLNKKNFYWKKFNLLVTNLVLNGCEYMEVLQNKKISLFSKRYSGPSQVRAAMASIVPILGLIS